MCGLPSTVPSYYYNHVATTNQMPQLDTQRHAYYTCTPRVYSHRHSGELAPNPTFVIQLLDAYYAAGGNFIDTAGKVTFVIYQSA
jgi:hypothetical protein